MRPAVLVHSDHPDTVEAGRVDAVSNSCLHGFAWLGGMGAAVLAGLGITVARRGNG